MHIAGYYIMWLLVFLQADYERRFLQLCDEGTADISQFRELLRQGVDVNIFDEVGINTIAAYALTTVCMIICAISTSIAA